MEADQGGTPHARARVSLVSWEGRSHALLFMVPLGLPSARPMAQALRLSFEYLLNNSFCIDDCLRNAFGKEMKGIFSYKLRRTPVIRLYCNQS